MGRQIWVLLTCAWVLWSLSTSPPDQREWTPLTGFETFTACVDAREHLSTRIDQAEQDGKHVEVQGVGVIMQVQCFPDSIDPRRPK